MGEKRGRVETKYLGRRPDIFTASYCYPENPEAGIDLFLEKLVQETEKEHEDILEQAVLDAKELELFDILNPDGSKTGIVRERVVAHREGSLHATVHMWIVRPNEKSGYDVLLQKRSQTKDSNPGSYRKQGNCKGDSQGTP